jgi:hypothetical protein
LFITPLLTLPIFFFMLMTSFLLLPLSLFSTTSSLCLILNSL